MSRINPALSDGRLTNYLSSCQLNSAIQRQFNIQSEVEYRSFIQTNPLVVQDFISRYADASSVPYHKVSPCPSHSQFTPAPY